MATAIIALIIIIGVILSLIIEKQHPVIIFFVALSIFILLGIITIEDAVLGFANQGLLTIAVLFIMVGAIQKTKGLSELANRLFGSLANRNPGSGSPANRSSANSSSGNESSAKESSGSEAPANETIANESSANESSDRGTSGSGRKSIFRIMLPVSIISAFINNIPIVALFIPLVRNWALKNKIAPSKLLIPLSYASIFGGTLTLVGTSTNLVVSGLLQEAGEPGLWMFETTLVGLPLAAAGIIYITVVGYKMLPQNEDTMETFKKTQNEYLVQIIVEQGCHLAGETVKQAGLRNLQGLYLIEIIRKDTYITPVSPGETILAGDKLLFTGQISTISQLQGIKGLKMETSAGEMLNLFNNGEAQLAEAVVSNSFPYQEQTIKESNFRALYDAAVVAVIRNGERIKEKIGSIRLRPGDTLLLITGDNFINLINHTRGLYLISKHETNTGHTPAKSITCITVFIAMILLASFNIFSMLTAAFLGLSVLFITKCVNFKEAKESINWEVIILLGLALGVGQAFANSGAANLVADTLFSALHPLGPVGIIATIYLLTSLFTHIITNNAAAVLVFPIALAAAQAMNLDIRPVAITIAIAASTCFATPVGYQTNLMIYGPGGYTFKDFIRIGLPLNLIFFILTIAIVPLLWQI